MGKTISTSSSSGITLTTGNYSTYNPLSITSTGTINTSGGSGVYSKYAKSWSISNAGSIISTKSSAGVGGIVLNKGGTVSNLTGGLIQGSLNGVILAGTNGGIITNSGTIKATAATGVGVKITAANATLVNAGTIAAASTSGTAVSMTGANGDRLVLDPGFAFTGTVIGNSYATLELAGTSAATLSGLATSIKSFGTVNVDASAKWTLANANSIASNVYFANAGSLTNTGTLTVSTSGAKLVDQGVLVNSGTISFGNSGVGSLPALTVASGASLTNQASGLIKGGTAVFAVYLDGNANFTNFGTVSAIKYGLGVYIKGSGNTLTNFGTIKYTGTINPLSVEFNGSNNRLIVEPGAVFSGSVLMDATDTLEFAGITAGTMTGLDSGTGIAGNGVTTIDAHAIWTLTGYLGGSVTNAGTLNASGSLSFGPGNLTNIGLIQGYLDLGSATLTNLAFVTGTANAIVSGSAIVNSSTIAAAVSGTGILLVGDASVTNNANALITGAAGVYDETGFVTLVNAGTIHGTYTNAPSYGAVGLRAGGNVTNLAGGVIAGGRYGVFFQSSGASTLVNAGTIEGNGTYPTAVYFDDTGGRLVVDPGAVFTGAVEGNSSDTIELAGTSAGTLSGFGTQFVNFGSLLVDASADWDLAGTTTIGSGINFTNDGTVVLANTETLTVVTGVTSDTGDAGKFSIAGGAILTLQTTVSSSQTVNLEGTGAIIALGDPTDFHATIAGMHDGETIDLTSIANSNVTSVNLLTGNTLQIVETSGSITLQLSPSDNFTGKYFHAAPDNGSGTFITEDEIPCFCRGTMILTDRGEVPVEMLAIGDRVVTLSDEAKPIKWIGWRSYAGRFLIGNRNLLPIRVVANALADGVPRRDLDVSPKHAIFIDGLLIPAEKLVNGVSVYQRQLAESVTYFHVELESHDIIFAEGASAESFVDCNNRGMFHNAHEFAQLYPDDSPAKWTFCAPRIEDGDLLWDVRRNLEKRLERFGSTTTFDSALLLLVDGADVAATRVDGCSYVFELTKQPADIRIVSRSSVPAEIMATSTDQRRLGVNLSRLVLSDQCITIDVDHRHPALTEGFHEAETTHRWTDGSARIPPELLAWFAQPMTIEVRMLDETMPYRSDTSFAHGSSLHQRPLRSRI